MSEVVYPTTLPKCPKAEWHTVDWFWFPEDPVTIPARGVLCLVCDDLIVAFDDETMRRYREKMARLGREAK